MERMRFGLLVKAFCAGFVAVLVFHQGMLSMLAAGGLTDRAIFPSGPTWPLGLPQIWSIAFWGGLWGIAFALLRPRLPSTGAAHWVAAAAFGAVAPTLVNWFVVAPLKSLPLAAGWAFAPMLTGVLVNAAWGVGTALFLHLALRRS